MGEEDYSKDELRQIDTNIERIHLRGKSIWDEWSSDSWAGFPAVSSDQQLS